MRPIAPFENKYMPEPMSGCWLWLYAVDRDGYGVFNNNRKAHQESYRLYKGTILKGLLVRHKCDQPSCVNPDHLILGTAQDNSDDMVKRNRQRKHENHPLAKLNSKQADEIRVSDKSTRILAKEYNISRHTISKIKRNLLWRIND